MSKQYWINLHTFFEEITYQILKKFKKPIDGTVYSEFD